MKETVRPAANAPEKSLNMGCRDGSHGSSSVFFILLLLPAASAFASYFAMRDALLAIFFVTALLVLLVSLRFRAVDKDRIFLILTISIALSLLLSTTLVSENISGFDIHEEFFIFLKTLQEGAWHAEELLPLSAPSYNSALSISILPSMVAEVSALDGVRVFKLLFPILFSLVPLVLYKIYRKVLVPEAAFLSVFLVMSGLTFYEEMPALGRQEIGEILLVLLIWLILSPGVGNRRSGRLLVLLLTAGLMMAHYSLAYVYLALVIFSLVVSGATRKTEPLGNLVTLFVSAVLTLSWYLFVARGAAVVTLASFFSSVFQAVSQDFFSPSSRPSVVLQALGLKSGLPGFLHDANRVSQYAVLLSLTLGYLIFACRSKKNKTERTLLPLMTIGMMLVVSAVVLPNFARGFNMSRFYHVALLFISPCFFYGVQGVQSGLGRVYALFGEHQPRFHVSPCRIWVVGASILFSYLLFTSGWVWAVSMDRPDSPILDMQRMENSQDPSLQLAYFNRYTVTQDIAAALWLRSSLPGGYPLCADSTSRYHVLVSYGELPSRGPKIPDDCDIPNSFIYMSTLNTVHGVGTKTFWLDAWLISDISTELALKNRVYSDSATIYD